MAESHCVVGLDLVRGIFQNTSGPRTYCPKMQLSRERACQAAWPDTGSAGP